MGKVSQWQDEYWLPLMQIYLQKPVGMKPMYSRKMVDLSLELHISPERLLNKMCQIANVETPRVEHFWEIYGNNPQKLARAVKLLREMKGFNNSEAFYDGVEVNESFERDFRPLAENSRFTPVMLILILDLYDKIRTWNRRQVFHLQLDGQLCGASRCCLLVHKVYPYLS